MSEPRTAAGRSLDDECGDEVVAGGSIREYILAIEAEARSLAPESEGLVRRKDVAEAMCFLAGHGQKHPEQPSCPVNRHEADRLVRALSARYAVRGAGLDLRIEQERRSAFLARTGDVNRWLDENDRVQGRAALASPDTGVAEGAGLREAATALVIAHDAWNDAVNGRGHRGEPHDQVLHHGPLVPGGIEVFSTTDDCAACGGAQYGTEDTMYGAVVAVKLALGLPLRPYEEQRREYASDAVRVALRPGYSEDMNAATPAPEEAPE